MKSLSRKLIKQAESLGYSHVSTNTDGYLRFEHPDAPAVLIPPGINEHGARKLTRQMQAATGNLTRQPKRDPAAVRARQASEREANREAIQRHERELTALRVKRTRLLAGRAAELNGAEVLAIAECIEEQERQIAYYRRLMSEVPASREHSGTSRTAKHQAGGR